MSKAKESEKYFAQQTKRQHLMEKQQSKQTGESSGKRSQDSPKEGRPLPQETQDMLEDMLEDMLKDGLEDMRKKNSGEKNTPLKINGYLVQNRFCTQTKDGKRQLRPCKPLLDEALKLPEIQVEAKNAKRSSFGQGDLHQILELMKERNKSFAGRYPGAESFSFCPEGRLFVGMGGLSPYSSVQLLRLHFLYGIPYIPASAIKGALRTCWLTEKFAGDEKQADEDFYRLFGQGKQSQDQPEEKGATCEVDQREGEKCAAYEVDQREGEKCATCEVDQREGEKCATCSADQREGERYATCEVDQQEEEKCAICSADQREGEKCAICSADRQGEEKCAEQIPGEEGKDNLVNPMQEGRQGALVFFDAFPVKYTLEYDVQTPHYSNYYQKGKEPVDTQQPIILSVICISESEIPLWIACQDKELWEKKSAEIREMVKCLFTQYGIGGKTAIGYGIQGSH